MTKEAIYQQVAEIVQEFRGKNFDVSEELSVQEGFADSVELMEFIIALEERFDIEISDEDADQFTSLGNLVDYIATKKA